MTRDTATLAIAIIALAGTTTATSANDWALPVDGNWNLATNWLGADVPDTVAEDAVLGLVGSYLVSVTNNFTHGGLSVTNPDATLTLASIFHTLSGDLLNGGTIIINTNASVFNSHLAFNSDAQISGNGVITLNGAGNGDDAQIIANAPFTVTHGADHTIHGAGRISGLMHNDGTILADSIVGALELNGTLTQSPTATAGAASGGKLSLNNGSLTTGGSFDTEPGSVVEVSGGTVTIGDITNLGTLNIPGSGRFLDLNDTLTNEGTIFINSNASVFNAHLRFIANTTLDGSGDVSMDASGGDLADAQILTNAAITGTIGSNQLVQGSGLITTAVDGLIINNGTINGNDPLIGLGLAGNHQGTSGIYRSDNGTILLRNGLVLDGGTFESTGTGSLTKDSNGTAFLSNITNNGQINILGGGAFIQLDGPMTNNGAISINSNESVFNAHLVTSSNVVIDGTGSVELATAGDINDAQITTQDAVTMTFGAGQVVSGSGNIAGDSDGLIQNLGVFNGNHAAMGKDPVRVLRLRGNHTGSSVGTYRSDDGKLGLGGGLFLTDATFDSSGAGIVEVLNNSTASVANITNLGHLGIQGNGSFLELAGPMVNTGTITVNTTLTNFNAHLVFADPSASITGNGEVRMSILNQFNDAQMYTDGAFNGTIGAGQTVAGSGVIEGRNDGTIVNNGIIDGDDPLNDLRLEGNHDGSGGGIYRSTDGVLALTGNLVLNGGTFQSVGTGSVSMNTNGSAEMTSVTNEGDLNILGNGGTIELFGPLTNNGTININSNLNNFNALIRFVTDTTIDGTGDINMSILNQNNDAQIIANSGFVGTIGAGQNLSGDGLLSGELEINGGLDPAGPTREFRIDDMRFSSTTHMTADLGGLLAGEFDRLILGGSDTIELAGDLTVNLDSGYVPNFGDTWDIIDGGTVVGEFDTDNMPIAGPGLVYRVIYEADRVFVILTCDADLSGDGVLDFFDISTFLGFFGAQDTRGDINLDGQFDFFDISLFLQIYSGTCS
ncbi:MAG: hypothetical protein JJ974_04475 [Phycisphaerales bacterium]|nr:hypothetical protein [Phycisphaerales bacterium]